MRNYLNLEIGQTHQEVEKTLNETIPLEEYQNENVHYLFFHDEEDGVWLFFKVDTRKLYTIRFEYPFPLEINDITLGMTKNEVKKLKGAPNRRWPISDDEYDIWFYDAEKLRLDFEKKRNGKLLIVFK